MTDAHVESDPGHAANWYLEFWAMVEEVELGKWSTNLAIFCFEEILILMKRKRAKAIEEPYT